MWKYGKCRKNDISVNKIDKHYLVGEGGGRCWVMCKDVAQPVARSHILEKCALATTGHAHCPALGPILRGLAWAILRSSGCWRKTASYNRL